MSERPTRTLYLATGGGTFAIFHPADGPPGSAAPSVLIVPPFGWDDVASYRARREWARALAGAGHPVLRIDLPGTGDSAGGPDDPDVVGRWVEAIGDATRWLCEQGDRERVVVLGLGLGGLLALAAVAGGAPAGELVLWGAPGRGRTATRELRAFSRLGENAGIELPPESGVVVNGHALRPATLDALKELDASALTLPPGLRALVLGRDGIDPDAVLLDALRGAGAEVATGPGAGWGAMLARPQDAVAPHGVFAEVESWLGRGGPGAGAPACGAAGATAAPASTETLELPGAVERPLVIDTPAGQTFGILTEPAGNGPATGTALLLNAGAIRRIGPNRMYVEAARRWAQHGIATLRLDVAGIGDADGEDTHWSDDASFHAPELSAQVAAASTTMAAREVMGGRPSLIGLCSGAHWAFHTALNDPGIAQVVLINTRSLFWADDLDAARDLRHYLTRARTPSTWLRLIRGELSFAYLRRRLPALLRRAAGAPRRLLSRAGSTETAEEPLDAAFSQLRDQGTKVTMLFSAEEPLYADFEHEGRLPRLAERGVDVRRIAGDVAAHTLQPEPVQNEVQAILDDLILGDRP